VEAGRVRVVWVAAPGVLRVFAVPDAAVVRVLVVRLAPPPWRGRARCLGAAARERLVEVVLGVVLEPATVGAALVAVEVADGAEGELAPQPARATVVISAAARSSRSMAGYPAADAIERETSSTGW
jgi:hypothetical protein